MVFCSIAVLFKKLLQYIYCIYFTFWAPKLYYLQYLGTNFFFSFVVLIFIHGVCFLVWCVTLVYELSCGNSSQLGLGVGLSREVPFCGNDLYLLILLRHSEFFYNYKFIGEIIFFHTDLRPIQSLCWKADIFLFHHFTEHITFWGCCLYLRSISSNLPHWSHSMSCFLVLDDH